jgi:hypothetical protein
MSFVNVQPESTFTKLNQVLRNQKRLLLVNVAVTTVLFGSLLASVAAMF